MNSVEIFSENLFNFLLDTCFLISVYEISICLMLMKKRSHFYWRLLLFIPYIVLTNNVIGIVDYFNTYLVFQYIHVGYLIYFFISVLICYFCFDDKFLHILYFCTAAYIVENLSKQIWEFISLVFFEGSVVTDNYYDPKPFLCSAVMVIVELFIFYIVIFVLVNQYRKHYDFHIKAGYIIGIEVVTLFFIVFLNYWATMMGYMNSITRFYAAAVDIALIIMQFVFFKSNQLQYENTVIQNLVEMQAQQFEMSRENIDLINTKAHDLKHQIAALQACGAGAEGGELRDAVISEAGGTVETFNAFAHTGNAVLDTVITQKSLYCENRGITMNCLLNGSSFDFISQSDLSALFGNIIDNAIEAVEQEAPENRIIDISMAAREKIVSVRAENYCSRRIEFSNGFPVSTKKKDGYHGYGTKSIAYIVRKYGGECEMRQEGNKFVLSIIFFS